MFANTSNIKIGGSIQTPKYTSPINNLGAQFSATKKQEHDGEMARTRQQQEQEKQEAKAQALAARAASQVWTRAELMLLLKAWRGVLSGPDVHRESSGEFDFRLYTRVVTLSQGEAERDEHSVRQQTKKLKRTFRFISEYNQRHSTAIAAGGGDDGDRAVGTRKSRGNAPWFALRPHERREAFMGGQRSNCTNSFTDIDEKMFQEMKDIMRQTMQQIKKRSAHAPVREKRERSWTAAELWSLLYAWGDVLEGPRRHSVNSTQFQARLYLRFVSIREGQTERDETSVRLQRRSLASLFYLIEWYNEKRSGERDWFSLTTAEREQHFKLWSLRSEEYAVIDRGMFSMLAYLLKLESAGNRLDTQQKRRALDRRDSPDNGGIVVDLVSDVERSDESDDDHFEHPGTSDSITLMKDTRCDDQFHSHQHDLESSGKAQRSDTKTFTPWNVDYVASVTDATSSRRMAGRRYASQSAEANGEVSNRGIDEAVDSVDSNDADESELHVAAPRKRQRMDPELLTIVDILEKQAQHLSTMLRQAREERAFDLEERREVLAQLRLDRESREKERAAWEVEREEMKQELSELRRQMSVKR